MGGIDYINVQPHRLPSSAGLTTQKFPNKIPCPVGSKSSSNAQFLPLAHWGSVSGISIRPNNPHPIFPSIDGRLQRGAS